MEDAAKGLQNISIDIRIGSSERLMTGVENFGKNNSYKICYRFISNMLLGWKELGLSHSPSKMEAVEIAKMADPYFVWLFEQEDGLGEFCRLYDFHDEVLNGVD